jgi:hypothetical protein
MVAYCCRSYSDPVVDKPYPTFQGCFITSASRVVYMNWVILMAYEAGKRLREPFR